MRMPEDPVRWSDEQLLAAIAVRDGDAFRAFYGRHLPLVLAYLMGETRDPELTADLAAEVFASVLLSAKRYRPEHGSAEPWLFGIARNVLGTSRRRRRVEDRARRRLGLAPLELGDEDLERVRASADAERSRVLELLDRLPEGERRAVSARILEEQGYDEIARTLRCSQLVVRKRVSRGLARLREEIQER